MNEQRDEIGLVMAKLLGTLEGVEICLDVAGEKTLAGQLRRAIEQGNRVQAYLNTISDEETSR